MIVPAESVKYTFKIWVSYNILYFTLLVLLSINTFDD